MTQAIQSPNRLTETKGRGAVKFQKETVVWTSLREGGGPSGGISTISRKHEKNKRCLGKSSPIVKRKNGRIEGRLAEKFSQSLKAALKGKVLEKELLKKRDLLEKTVVFTGEEGGEMSLSQYLHQRGFSYDSQASIVSVKAVNTYMIYYLVALFFKRSENPLKEGDFKACILERFSDKWAVIEDILKETDPLISTESAVLCLLKNQGVAYESLIVFLDLFEKNEGCLKGRAKKETAQQAVRYEDVSYPFDKKRFIRDILEISKGGVGCMKGYTEIFVKSLSNGRSEWEVLKDSFWEEILSVVEKDSNLEGGYLRCGGNDWVITSDNLYAMGRKLRVVNRDNPDIEKVLIVSNDHQSIFFLGESTRFKNEACFVKVPDVSEEIILNHLIKCIRTKGGTKNKHAFMNCMNKPEIHSGKKKISLYHFLRSKQGGGLSAAEVLDVLSKCISPGGGASNKKVFLESFILPEVNLDGEMVTLYDFLRSEKGGGLTASKALNVIAVCIGQVGGRRAKFHY